MHTAFHLSLSPDGLLLHTTPHCLDEWRPSLAQVEAPLLRLPASTSVNFQSTNRKLLSSTQQVASTLRRPSRKLPAIASKPAISITTSHLYLAINQLLFASPTRRRRPNPTDRILLQPSRKLQLPTKALPSTFGFACTCLPTCAYSSKPSGRIKREIKKINHHDHTANFFFSSRFVQSPIWSTRAQIFEMNSQLPSSFASAAAGQSNRDPRGSREGRGNGSGEWFVFFFGGGLRSLYSPIAFGTR